MNKQNNKRPMGIVERAKKSFVGKAVCRVMGEESGAVMMEYVIVAVMIAAAVMVGAWFFGKDIMNMFGVSGQAVTGNPKGAATLEQAAVNGAASGHAEATTRNKDFINTDNEKTGDIKTSDVKLK